MINTLGGISVRALLGVLIVASLSGCYPDAEKIDFVDMKWIFSHQCQAAGEIRFRMFDLTSSPVRVWPNESQDYVLPDGATQSRDIACLAGAKICYGAEPTTGSVYWGMGLHRQHGCTACCKICAATVFAANLACP
jgi:hypothetical protein